MSNKLEQAAMLVMDAQDLIKQNEHPEIWKALHEAFVLINDRFEYEEEMKKFEDS
jgi:hypothetical protein